MLISTAGQGGPFDDQHALSRDDLGAVPRAAGAGACPRIRRWEGYAEGVLAWRARPPSVRFLGSLEQLQRAAPDCDGLHGDPYYLRWSLLCSGYRRLSLLAHPA